MKNQWMGLTIAQMKLVLETLPAESFLYEHIQEGLRIVTTPEFNFKSDKFEDLKVYNLFNEELVLRRRYYRNRQVNKKGFALPYQRIVEILHDREMFYNANLDRHESKVSNNEKLWLLDPENQVF